MGIHKRKREAKIDLQPSKKNNITAGKLLWSLAAEFELSMDDLSILLDVKERTLYNAKSGMSLPTPCNDRYRRISLLLGIKKNLEILFPRNPEVRRNWLKVPREVFKGRSALQMLKDKPIESMSRLFTVRRRLGMYCNGALNSLV